MIRNAKLSDAKKILEIIKSANINRYSPEITGFVELPIPSLKKIANQISENPYFYVAEESKGVVGFLSAFTDQRLEEFQDRENLENHLLEKERPFIYWELLGTDKKYQEQGIGKMLSEHLLNETRNYPTLYGPISHKPHKNTVSIKLLEDLGWKPSEEINACDGITFGIYTYKNP